MNERRRAFLPRLLLYTTGAAGLFYGVSTVVALNNQAYQDWFSDSVPVSRWIISLAPSGSAAHPLSRFSIAPCISVC
jgi:hypothetical protein